MGLGGGLLQHLRCRRESLSLGFGEVRIILKGDKSIVRQFVQQRVNCSETSQLIRVRYHAKNLSPPRKMNGGFTADLL